jgi:hypothetical protein
MQVCWQEYICGSPPLPAPISTGRVAMVWGSTPCLAVFSLLLACRCWFGYITNIGGDETGFRQSAIVSSKVSEPKPVVVVCSCCRPTAVFIPSRSWRCHQRVGPRLPRNENRGNSQVSASAYARRRLLARAEDLTHTPPHHH